MLIQLTVKNFVLIDAISIDFKRGLSVFTGETGAGKSLIVDAISLLSGARASSDLIANNQERAIVEGVFHLDASSIAGQLATEAGYDVSDVIVFTREITKDNKNTCKINHRIVPLSIFKRILQTEIDIHSQHDTQYLLQDKHHITLLDNYMHQPSLLDELASAYADYQATTEAVKRIEQEVLDETDRDYLVFQQNELRLFEPSHEDYDECIAKQRHLTSFEKISQNTNQALELLNQDGGLIELAYEVMQRLEAVSEDDTLKQFASSMMDVHANLEDIKENLSDYVYSLSFDQDDFDQIMERLGTYDRFKRKYGGSIDAIIEHMQNLEDTLYRLDHHQQVLEAAQQKNKQAFLLYEQKAKKVSQQRKEAAKRLSQAIHYHLKDLQLEHAQFEVRFETSKPAKLGMDKVIFYLRTNPGSALAPLVKVASGGELSRLMLGLKAIFTPLQGCGTIIFDEIDVGVSGKVAHRVGAKMHELAQNVQTFTITHLAVVAAFGDQHYRITKSSTTTATTVHVDQLTNQTRIEQLALLSSGQLNEPSIAAAQAMFDSVQSEINHE